MNYTFENRVSEYKHYIDEHIRNIKIAYNFYGKQLCERLGVDYERLGDMIKVHDRSKYTEEEFEGYRAYFYPTPEEKEDTENAGYIKKKFDAAWLHHLRNNSHHPEFWIRTNNDNIPICEVMDKLSIAEMLLDWAAMGITKGDTAYSYYNNNIGNKPFNITTIDIIDTCIDIFKEKIPIEENN